MSEELTIEMSALKQALEFYDQGFTQWNDEKQLFIDAARVLEVTMQREAKLREVLEVIAKYDPTPNYQGAIAQQALTSEYPAESE